MNKAIHLRGFRRNKWNNRHKNPCPDSTVITSKLTNVAYVLARVLLDARIRESSLFGWHSMEAFICSRNNVPPMNVPLLSASTMQEATFQQWLNEYFQSEFHVWTRQESGDWKSNTQLRSFPELNVPTLRQLGTSHYELIVPVQVGNFVCTTERSSHDEELLQSYAMVIQRDINNAAKLNELQAENEEFTEQTISNFEQLAFLKQSARQLLLADTTYGLEAMAQDILPNLQGLIQAQDVQLYIIDSEKTQSNPVFGGDSIDPLAVQFLIDKYSSEALDVPFVLNCWADSEDYLECPEIDNFVLACVKHCDQLLGWLIAVNRSEPEFRLTTKYENDPTPLSEAEFGTVEADLISSAASMLATHYFNVDLMREKELLLTNIIRALASALDAKDPYTCGHSERVAVFAKRIAIELGMSDEKIEEIYLTGLLHDIGKIGIDDATLTYPGPLTDEQYSKIKTHPDGGWCILHGITQLRYVLPGVLYHHESFDGSGYPDGLAGTEIPIEARILAVADSYDAMTSSRPYRSGMSHEKAIGILTDGAGSQWDPEIIDVFLAIQGELEMIGANTDAMRSPARRTKGTVDVAT